MVNPSELQPHRTPVQLIILNVGYRVLPRNTPLLLIGAKSKMLKNNKIKATLATNNYFSQDKWEGMNNRCSL